MELFDLHHGTFPVPNGPGPVHNGTCLVPTARKPGKVRANDPLLLISLDLDEVDIYRYTDRRRSISDSPGTLPDFVLMIRFGEYHE
jgi:hypothetical protein